MSKFKQEDKVKALMSNTVIRRKYTVRHDIEIEAIQWTGNNLKDLKSFIPDVEILAGDKPFARQNIAVVQLSPSIWLYPSEYLIWNGTSYCKKTKEEFEGLYQPIENV